MLGLLHSGPRGRTGLRASTSDSSAAPAGLATLREGSAAHPALATAGEPAECLRVQHVLALVQGWDDLGHAAGLLPDGDGARLGLAVRADLHGRRIPAALDGGGRDEDYVAGEDLDLDAAEARGADLGAGGELIQGDGHRGRAVGVGLDRGYRAGGSAASALATLRERGAVGAALGHAATLGGGHAASLRLRHAALPGLREAPTAAHERH